MSTPAERLTELWRQSCAHPNRIREIDAELLQLMDTELERGRLTAPLLAACGEVDDPLDLWHLGHALAEEIGQDKGPAPLASRLVFLSAVGYLKDLDAWADRGHFASGLRAAVDMQCDALGIEPQSVRVTCCSVPLHPAALAVANPDELRSLLTLVRRQASAEAVEEHPIVQRHRALEAADPLRHTPLRLCGSRICVATVSAADELARGNEHGREGVFDRLFSEHALPFDTWHEILETHGCLEEAAMEVLAPLRFAEALFESLHNHLLQAWAIDLDDRGGHDDDGHVLEFSDDALSFITAVDFAPTEHGTVVVQAHSTLGALVPVEVPLAWAQAGGPGSLEQCVSNLLAGGPEQEETGPVPDPAFSPSPKAARRLH